MSTTAADMRRELAQLFALASEAQIAAVMREWAHDTGYDSAPRLILADLVGRMRATLHSEYAEPQSAADAVQRLHGLLRALGAK